MATSIRLLKRHLRKEIQQSLKSLSQSQIAEECESPNFFTKLTSSIPLRKNLIPTPLFRQLPECLRVPLHAYRRITNQRYHREVFSIRFRL